MASSPKEHFDQISNLKRPNYLPDRMVFYHNRTLAPKLVLQLHPQMIGAPDIKKIPSFDPFQINRPGGKDGLKGILRTTSTSSTVNISFTKVASHP